MDKETHLQANSKEQKAANKRHKTPSKEKDMILALNSRAVLVK